MFTLCNHVYPFVKAQDAHATPLIVLDEAHLEEYLQSQGKPFQAWLNAHSFKAAPAELLSLPSQQQERAGVIVGIDATEVLYCLGDLSQRLSPGTYQVVDPFQLLDISSAALGFALGAYHFNCFKPNAVDKAVFLALDDVLYNALKPQVNTLYWVRDLINAPTELLGPAQLADEALALAKRYDADCRVIVGDALLHENYPLIHAVGRASALAPRLVELSWGKMEHPRISLVGKGVCFDSGGLNLKSGEGMLTMKKDMGGAAQALGLSQLIMHHKLPIRLQLLLPIAENAVSGNAFRPGDIFFSRKGLSIEISNTDAEGRLLLADALARAAETTPELILDFSTLTGAARVALGPAVPAYFSNSKTLSQALMAASDTVHDPIWPLPLYAPYKKMIRGKWADLTNSAAGGHAGAITAALFLAYFVPQDIPWAHFDLMAWNPSAQPGRPEGGEAMTLRAAFQYLVGRYAH
jgi:leucyl aminopeptidase